MGRMSAYEAARDRNIEENSKLLSELGLNRTSRRPAAKRVAAASRIRKEHPARRSQRAQGKAPVKYTPPNPVDERENSGSNQREEIRKGFRTPDGRWRGERYGAVAGVEVGAVFGRGDFQRRGRREMSDTGFFEPFVTPEWIDRNGGCFSLILNNDNGLSSDNGETVVYAGAGGRMRGQNRTAAQTFSQTFDSATNRALKYNCDHRLPVRLIRGPKLSGPHGTAGCGGGYRFDGLFDVVKAELKPTPPRGLLTALFTLHKR